MSSIGKREKKITQKKLKIKQTTNTSTSKQNHENQTILLKVYINVFCVIKVTLTLGGGNM